MPLLTCAGFCGGYYVHVLNLMKTTVIYWEKTLTTKSTCVLSINECTEVTFRAARWNANRHQEHDNISQAQFNHDLFFLIFARVLSSLIMNDLIIKQIFLSKLVRIHYVSLFIMHPSNATLFQVFWTCKLTLSLQKQESFWFLCFVLPDFMK